MATLWICDVNGVLIDTSAVVRDAFAATAERFGVAFGERAFQMVRSLWLEDAYRTLAPELDQARLCHYHVQHLRARVCDVKAYAGVKEMLAEARARNVAVAAATSYGEIAEACLTATGLYQHVDCLVTQEEVRRHKPHPDMLVRILELFDTVVDRESVVYVGDTPNDIEAGKRARVLTVGVTYGLSSSDEIRAAAPDEVIDSFDQMRMFLTAPACRRTTATAAQRIPMAEV